MANTWTRQKQEIYRKSRTRHEPRVRYTDASGYKYIFAAPAERRRYAFSGISDNIHSPPHEIFLAMQMHTISVMQSREESEEKLRTKINMCDEHIVDLERASPRLNLESFPHLFAASISRFQTRIHLRGCSRSEYVGYLFRSRRLTHYDTDGDVKEEKISQLVVSLSPSPSFK